MDEAIYSRLPMFLPAALRYSDVNIRQPPKIAEPSPESPIDVRRFGEIAMEIITPCANTPKKSPSVATTISKNMALGLARVAINSIVALVLPAYLTHRLPVTTYAAWVLILQLAAFVSFLDLGVQTGIAKFVAEHHARHDDIEAGRYAGAGFAMMALAAILGLALTLLLVWQVPDLFHNMPTSLYKDVRISVLLVGISLSFGLLCSVFAAVFIGLQQYAIPTGLAILNRGIYTFVVCIIAFHHGSLVAMGSAVALVNVSTGLLQVAAWRAKLSHIRVFSRKVNPKVVKEMLHYCLVLAIWSAAMLCISGLDVTIVGHYAFKETAYYSLATLPANLVILIISSTLGPFMPAASALSTQRTPTDMGNILFRITRYSVLLILLTGLPLLVGAYPILRLWVGGNYALHSVRYLQILMLATIIRNLCLPYATMVVATGRQKFATAAAIGEAIVNLGGSIYFAHLYGAIGVAVGTLLGALVSIAMHFAISMHYTYTTILVARWHFFIGALLRPTIIAIPSLLLLPFWNKSSEQSLSMSLWILWAISTLLITWFGGLNPNERTSLLQIVRVR
jgi:O-antigen/teichoic acid export membrane protein